MSLLLPVVQLLHVTLVLFVLFVPFSPNLNWHWYVLHFTTVASLLVHWLYNDDTCFLTLVESSLTGTKVKNTFIHSIVSPIYKISDLHVRTTTTYLTIILGLMSLVRIFKQWFQIKIDISKLKQQWNTSLPAPSQRMMQNPLWI